MATFYNQATLSYRGGVTASNVVSGELVETLSVNKTSASTSYAPGEELTYLVNLINTGATTLSALSVTDDLGAYAVGTQTYVPLSYVEGSARYYVNGVLTSSPTPTSLSPLVFGSLSVPADSNALLLYRAQVNEFASPEGGAAVVNTVTVTGGGITTPVTASATVTAQPGANLSISKAIDPAVVSENDRLTYTFVIENTGNEPATATDDLVISDTFTPVLSDLAVTLNGAVWPAAGNYTYDEATGAFATLQGSVTVPAATYTQDAQTGEWTVIPGVTVIQVSGTV